MDGWKVIMGHQLSQPARELWWLCEEGVWVGVVQSTRTREYGVGVT